MFVLFSQKEQAEAQERQEEVVRVLKEELEKKCVLSLCTIQPVLVMHVFTIFVLFSLAEQAEAQARQEQKVSELVEELKAATSDRDSLEKKYQELGKEMKRGMSELAHTQTE